MMKLPSPDTRRRARRAAAFGVLLGLLCSALPHDYREACRAVASICTGGFSP
jgi:hypothetical protein